LTHPRCHDYVFNTVPDPVLAALADPNWRATMEDEYGALMSNGTCDLISLPQGSNIVTDKWVFTHKFHADGAFDRYKACWVIRGFTQRPRLATAVSHN
jgi:hypothetical protein